jgi:hypothetical protein
LSENYNLLQSHSSDFPRDNNTVSTAATIQAKKDEKTTSKNNLPTQKQRKKLTNCHVTVRKIDISSISEESTFKD